ncbi:MAG TPA: hypothetical protein VNW06_02025 [Cytophagaceae bacterium]|jgi:hypothetical protein|nr:hypothetical protein [Cytophagaceae bacterium]
MAITSDNCIVCAEEFDVTELKSVALSTVNVTKFKICKNCLAASDPADDYREVRAIVDSFLKMDNKL